MIQFSGKYPSETRNAGVDFAPALSGGETLTGTPTVIMVQGDMTVSGAVIVGTQVQFRLAGGTVDAVRALSQIVAVRCATSAGEVLEEVVKVPILAEA